MKCYIHKDTDAIGVCTKCGKNVCPICAVDVYDNLLCKSCAVKVIIQQTPNAAPQIEFRSIPKTIVQEDHNRRI